MGDEIKKKLAQLMFFGSNRIKFYEVLKLQIKSGRTLEQAMKNIFEVYTRGGTRFHLFGELARDCLESLSANREGNLLPDVFQRWFSGEEASSLAVALRSDSLIAALDSLVRLNNDLQSIRSLIIGATLAPFAAVLSLSGVLTLMSVQLVPQFARIIPPEKAHGSLALTYGLADFVTTEGPWLLMLFIVISVASLWSLPRWTGPLRRMADPFPPFNLYKLMQSSIWMLNMATLIKAKMTFNDALTTLNNSGSPWLKERLEPTICHFSNGDDLGTALENSGHGFPSEEMILHLKALSVGEGAPLAIESLAHWWLGRTRIIARGILYLSMIVSVVMVFGCLSIMASSMMALQDMMHM